MPAEIRVFTFEQVQDWVAGLPDNFVFDMRKPFTPACPGCLLIELGLHFYGEPDEDEILRASYNAVNVCGPLELDSFRPIRICLEFRGLTHYIIGLLRKRQQVWSAREMQAFLGQPLSIVKDIREEYTNEVN